MACAALWLAVAVAAARFSTGWYSTAFIYGLSSTLALQSVLLLANLRQGRLLGNGNIMRGLGAGPMRRHKLIAVFAVLMIGWVCNYIA